MFSTAARHLKAEAFYQLNRDLNIRRSIITGTVSAIFPDNKIFFNRIKKNANTFVTICLHEAVFGPSDLSSKKIKKSIAQPTWLTPHQMLDFRNYFSFVIIRNPYHRLLSAFLDKVGRSGSNVMLRHIPGFEDPTPEGFRSFITYLENEGLYEDKHWWPQRDLMLFPLSRFNRVIRMEKMGQDLAIMFEELNLYKSESLRLQYGTIHDKEKIDQKLTDACRRTESFYFGDLSSRVYALYAHDFQELGYSNAEL